MRAIKVDAFERTITEVQVDGLKDMQAAVDGYIQIALELPNGDTIFVNEEGLLKGWDAWIYYEGQMQPWIGSAIIVGHDGEGESIDAKSTVEEIKNNIRFLSTDDVLDFEYIKPRKE